MAKRSDEAVAAVGAKACEVAAATYGGEWEVVSGKPKVAKKDVMFIVPSGASITIRTDYKMLTSGKQTWLISLECEGENANQDLLNLRARIAELLAP